MFDFSNYSKYSKFFDATNKKVIDKMKDEFGGVIVNEFVGLKSKMYSITKTGIYEIDKISLLCFDDERFVLDNGTHKLAYFNKNSVTGCKKN